MPICKIYHVTPVSVTQEQLDKIEAIILNHLEALDERAEVIFIPATCIQFGKDCYVELYCRNKPNRTTDKLMSLSNALDSYIHQLFGNIAPFKTRIIKIDEDHLTGKN